MTSILEENKKTEGKHPRPERDDYLGRTLDKITVLLQSVNHAFDSLIITSRRILPQGCLSRSYV